MGALPIEGPVVETIVATRFALDGGAMFGIVPRVLWERVAVPDARHRVPLAARVLLVQDRARGICALVDCGLGAKWSAKEREIYAIEGADGLEVGLRARGVAPSDVTDVVLTHLHWDHAGGVSRADAAPLELSFPAARHHVSRAHLDDVSRASAKDAGSFLRDDVALLRASGRLEIHDGWGAWLPGIDARPSDGHAAGLAIVHVGNGRGPRAVFPADLVPTSAHVRIAWVMAYDNAPRVSATEKALLLAECARRRDVLVLEHDPTVAAATVSPSAAGEFALTPVEAD